MSNIDTFTTAIPLSLRDLVEQGGRVSRVRWLKEFVPGVGGMETICDVCERLYPCPTIRALDVRHDPSATTDGGDDRG